MATTEWARAGSVVEDGGGTIAWTGEENLAAGGSGPASYSGAGGFTQTNIIDASDSSKQLSIPAGSMIRGVEVRFRTSGGSGSAVLNGLTMVGEDGTPRADQAGGEEFVGDQEHIFGGPTDLMGLESTTDFENVNVGFRWQLTNLSDSNAVTLDAAELRVHYLPRQGRGNAAVFMIIMQFVHRRMKRR